MRVLALTVFVVLLAAYALIIGWLAIVPASILYSKPPEPQAPFAHYLRVMWMHELAMFASGVVVAAYSILLFRKQRDWRPFAVLLIGVPFAVGIFQVFGL
jgi:hypothetical protein